jgi:lactoylglutathione lyase
MPAPTAGPVHHIALAVADLERALRFYTETLGLRPTLRMQIAGANFERLLRFPPGTTGEVAFVQGPPRVGQIELIQWSRPDGTRGPAATRPAGDGTSPLLSFSVTEPLSEWHARLTAAGAPCWSEPIELELPDYGPIEAFIAEDPDGHTVELVRLPSDEQVRAFRARDAQIGSPVSPPIA